MQAILSEEEAWSLMTAISSYVIDKSGVAQEGKQAIRRWRTDRAVGTPAMDELAEGMNEALATHMGVVTDRQVRRKGRFARKSAR